MTQETSPATSHDPEAQAVQTELDDLIAGHQEAGMTLDEARTAAIDELAQRAEAERGSGNEEEGSEGGKPIELPKPPRGRKNPGRNPGQGSRKKHNDGRPEPKGHRDHPYKQSKHEKWAKGYADENIRLFLDPDNISEGQGERSEGSEELKILVTARTRLAEASVHARRGTLTFRSERQRQEFADAATEYREARGDFIKHYLENSGASSVAQKRALEALLESREDGALMGEEINYYLQKEASRYKQATEKAFAWYKGKSKPVQIALGVGVAAGVGILTGFIGGGAAAGAMLGGRIGRGYFSREANRSGPVSSITEKQQQATLRASGMEDYIKNYETLRAYNRGKKVENSGLIAESQRAHTDAFLTAENRPGGEENGHQTYADALEETGEEAKAKRTSLGGAALGAVAGAGVGRLIEDVVPFDGLLRGEEPDVDAPRQIESEKDLTPEERRLLKGTEGADTDVGVEAPEVTEEHVEELRDEISDLRSQLEEEAARRAELEEALRQLQETGDPETVAGDISAELGLPEGYIAETDSGYEVTAMRDGQTDSIWRAAEHSLHHHLGRPPSVAEINALQNMLGDHWLDVGDKVIISNAQIEQALSSVSH